MKKEVFLICILLLPISLAFCGDGKIDNTEDCKTCPEDNPCFIDPTCIDHSCISRIIPPLFIKTDAEATIIIPQDIADSLNNRFNQETEFVSCLKGKYAEKIYQVTKETYPNVLEDSPFHIEHTGCPKFGTIATIHSHLDGSCTPSKEDLVSYGRKKEPLMAIICGENNYAFYSQENINKKLNYIIRTIPKKKNYYTLFYFPWIFSLVLIIILIIVLYEKHRILRKKNKEIALNIMEEFNVSERKIMNILIELGELPRKNIPLSIFTKLNKENVIEVKGTIVKLKEWFRNALKEL